MLLKFYSIGSHPTLASLLQIGNARRDGNRQVTWDQQGTMTGVSRSMASIGGVVS